MLIFPKYPETSRLESADVISVQVAEICHQREKPLNSLQLSLPTCWVTTWPPTESTRATSRGSNSSCRLMTRSKADSTNGNSKLLHLTISTPRGAKRFLAIGAFTFHSSVAVVLAGSAP